MSSFKEITGGIKEKLVKTLLGESSVHYLKGMDFHDNGDYEKANIEFDKAIKIEPYDDETLYQKSLLLSELDRNQEALQSIENALKIEPKNIDYISQKADVLHDLEKFREALLLYAKITKEDPENILAWHTQCDILSHLGMHEESLKAAEMTVKLDPYDPVSWYNKADSLYDLERYKDAINSIDKALKLDPKDNEFLLLKGKCLWELGKNKDAEKIALKILDKEPDNEDAVVLQLCSIDMDSDSKLLEVIEQHIKTIPKDEDIWYNKAQVLARLGHVDDALDSLIIALSISSKFDKKFKEDSNFEKIKNHDRFQKLIKQK